MTTHFVFLLQFYLIRKLHAWSGRSCSFNSSRGGYKWRVRSYKHPAQKAINYWKLSFYDFSHLLLWFSNLFSTLLIEWKVKKLNLKQLEKWKLWNLSKIFLENSIKKEIYRNGISSFSVVISSDSKVSNYFFRRKFPHFENIW